MVALLVTPCREPLPVPVGVQADADTVHRLADAPPGPVRTAQS